MAAGPQHPDEVTGSAPLSQVPQVDAGRGSGPHDPSPSADPANGLDSTGLEMGVSGPKVLLEIELRPLYAGLQFRLQTWRNIPLWAT